MDIQEWDISIPDQISLYSYDLITVRLEDGREIPVWTRHQEVEQQPESGQLAKLVFFSKYKITELQVRELQQNLMNRSDLGWYHDLDTGFFNG